MSNREGTPKFPDSYIGDKSIEYDNSTWMERNQKKTTLLCLQYLRDDKLDNLGNYDVLKGNHYLIVDLGCGSGFSSEVLVDSGHRIIGIDILIDMLSKAKTKKKNLENKKNLELILADINSLPLRKTSFNHIISISAYNFIIYGTETIRDRFKTVNNTAMNLKKILKPKGRIIIEFYPKDEKELDLFISSFNNNGFDGFMIKKNPTQKAGQTFLLLKKR
jgi:ubiquinone/menaquinone biosynthesis C-methylase UbiE